MWAYKRMIKTILQSGNTRTDRTGVGTHGIFGYQFRHNLELGFPLLTTKRIFFKGVVEELLWMLRGETNIRSLQAAGVHIWDEWADENGELGPVYGKQWRDFGGVDQIANVIDNIRRTPDSRRLIVSAWNPPDIALQKLPPCHALFQFYVDNGRLSCHMYQRSADAFLGVPFNIASYALLTHIIARRVQLTVGELIISFGDLHIYNNHRDQIEEQMKRTPRALPRLYLSGDVRRDPREYSLANGDFVLEDYNPRDSIKASVAV